MNLKFALFPQRMNCGLGNHECVLQHQLQHKAALPSNVDESPLQVTTRQARLAGDLNAWQFPAVLQLPRQQGGAHQVVWEPFSFKLLKDLKAAVGQYGPNSPFVRSLLQSVAQNK